METLLSRLGRRVAATLLAVMLTIPATNLTALASDSPAGMTQNGVDAIIAGDFASIEGYLCRDRRDSLMESLDLPRAIDPSGAYPAELLKTVGVTVLAASGGERSLSGDTAVVRMQLAIAVDMNAIKQRRIVTEAIESAEGYADTWEVHAEIAAMAAALPGLIMVDTEVDVIREDGEWRICEDFLGPDARTTETPFPTPAPSVEP